MNRITIRRHHRRGTGVYDVRGFWENTLQTQIHTCFKVYAEYEAYAGEPRLFPWMDNVVPLPAGNTNELKKLDLLHAGIAAALSRMVAWAMGW